MLKAAMLAVALLTGAVRDMHGIPVGGATITGLDRTGAPLGHATTDADGTFALDTPATPVSVRVECAYCRTLTLAVASGEPIVAIVQRYDALLANGPTEWDLAALPYTRLENALALRPFEVLRTPVNSQPFFGPSIADRGLAFNALVLDGDAPTYAVGFGELGGLSTTPAHAGTLVNFLDSSEAYRYGAYASGGVIQLTRNPALVEQAAAGDVNLLRFSAGDANIGLTAASESDDLVQRERVAAGAQAGVLGGSLSAQFTASRSDSAALGNPRVSLDTASVAFARTFGGYEFRFSAADGFGTVASGPIFAVWNDVALHAAVERRTGAFAIEAGTNYVNDSYTIAPNLSYASDTTYLQATLLGPTSVRAGIAQTIYLGEAASSKSATLPSLLVTQSLGRFALTAGISQSLPQVNLYGAPVVASLEELHLDYGDGNRLRADVQTYRQVFAPGMLAGSGAAITYQLTPQMSVRAWSLRLFGDQNAYDAQAYISGDSLWTTYQNGGFRLDAIYRRTAALYGNQRAVDGDIYFPVARNLSIGLRSELQPQGRRSALVLTLSP